MISIEDQKDEFYLANDRPELISFLPKYAKKILDVGYAEGNFGASLKNETEQKFGALSTAKIQQPGRKRNWDKVLVEVHNNLSKKCQIIALS